MTNPQTQRKLKRLAIDTREEQVSPKPECRSLLGRTINSALPVPPPWSSSVPPITAQTPSTIKHSRLNQTDPTTIAKKLQRTESQVLRRPWYHRCWQYKPEASICHWAIEKETENGKWDPWYKFNRVYHTYTRSPELSMIQWTKHFT